MNKSLANPIFVSNVNALKIFLNTDQNGLAEKAYMHYATLSKLINGKSEITEHSLKKLAGTLIPYGIQIDPNDLLTKDITHQLQKGKRPDTIKEPEATTEAEMIRSIRILETGDPDKPLHPTTIKSIVGCLSAINLDIELLNMLKQTIGLIARGANGERNKPSGMADDQRDKR